VLVGEVEGAFVREEDLERRHPVVDDALELVPHLAVEPHD
jgi:hypothetical protein